MTAKKRPTKKSPAKKHPTKKSPAKKRPTKKCPANKRPTKKSPANKRSAKATASDSGPFAEVHDIVRSIPHGRVMTYGSISRCIERRLSPLAVGWALNGCPEDVPWQRVVNASGGCSTDKRPGLPGGLQRFRLEEEGITFRANGTVDLAAYEWSPRVG